MTSAPRRVWIAAGSMVGLASAAAFQFLLHHSSLADHVLLVTLLAGGLPLVWSTTAGLMRGRFAADVVAALAIVGAAILGQYFAGTIIVLMQAGGEALDATAMSRASQSLEALLSRAPRIARRRRNGIVEDVAATEVAPGDELVMRPGDMVPVDCIVIDGRSSVDASALTGEPEPSPASAGTTLLSGCINQDGALTVRALRAAEQSQYSQIVRLVEQARTEKAPIQRLADRYAMWFTPLTLLMCGVAWLIGHDATRVLAVLVVATPCPLILATPVAVIAGIGRAARRGIVFRHGGAIETVGRADTIVFDKTGTLTLGHPAVDGVVATGVHDADTVLRLAAAVEVRSSHHMGQAIAEEGQRRFGALPDVLRFQEAAGEGVEGQVDDMLVKVGSERWTGCVDSTASHNALASLAFVSVDGCPAGLIRFADHLRPEAPALIASLKAMGVRRSIMLTGDGRAAAEAIARLAGIDIVYADLLPKDKVERIGELRRSGRVLMVGDGINDAPALAAASVGIAMGAHAPAAAAEAADIVVLVDDIARVAEAIEIGQRTRRIALQSIGVGLGVSGALMTVAALGHIVPAAGALLQEALDVGVILNALRARHAAAI